MDEGHCLESFPVASVKYPRHVWFMATQQDAIKCDPQIPQGEACMSPAEPFCPPSHAGSAGPLLPPPPGNRRGLRGGGDAMPKAICCPSLSMRGGHLGSGFSELKGTPQGCPRHARGFQS